MTHADIVHAALALSDEDRLALIERLMDSFDSEDESITNREWTHAWASEAADRLDALDQGRVTGVDADTVHRALRKQFGG